MTLVATNLLVYPAFVDAPERERARLARGARFVRLISARVRGRRWSPPSDG